MASRRIALIAGSVAVLGLIAAAVLVLPRVFGPNLSDVSDVADIFGDPHVSWTYDFVGDNDTEFLDETPQVTTIGDHRALVWASFDYSGYLEENGGSGWYKGYDEQYDQGFDAGQQYADDVEAYNADTYPYTIPTPLEASYFPADAYDNEVEYLGFHDGFDDGRAGKPIGSSRKQAPPIPDFTPAVTALDTSNGAVLWTTNLAEAVEGVDYSSTYFAQEVEGSNAVAVFVSTYGGLEASYAVVALDKDTGAVLSQLSTPGSVTGASIDGDLVLAIADETGESSRVARYSTDGLGKDPRWSVEVEGSAYLAVGEGFVIVQGSEHGTVLTASNGEKAGWGQDIDYDTSYAFIGSQLVRIETANDADTYSVQGWTTSGTSSWSEPITVTYFELTDTGLFSLEGSDTGYSALQRVDPSTGQFAWKQKFAETFDYMLGVQGDALLLHSGSTVIVLDLASGEKRLSEKLGDFSIVYEGSSLYYVPLGGELVAHRYSSAGAVWSYALTDSQTATAAGGRLAIVDSDKGTLSGLAG